MKQSVRVSYDESWNLTLEPVEITDGEHEARVARVGFSQARDDRERFDQSPEALARYEAKVYTGLNVCQCCGANVSDESICFACGAVLVVTPYRERTA